MRAARRRAPPAAPGEGDGLARGIALGFVAMLPLLAVYEAALAAGGPAGPRNAAEVLLSAPLAPLPGPVAIARQALVLVLAVLALAHLRLALARAASAALRIALEGAGFALLLGPFLVLLLPALGADLPPLGDGAERGGVGLARGTRLLGGGAYEEIVFRVGVFSITWLAARRTALFLGGASRPALAAAEVLAVAASSLAFAAFHLEGVARLLGPGGEPFRASVFAWRAAAGALLAGIYRWRGPGVAAWTHGLFNLFLVLGSGPGVLAGR